MTNAGDAMPLTPRLLGLAARAAALLQAQRETVGVVASSFRLAGVEVYAKRLQIQEKMTAEIATCLDEVLKPHGVAVVTEATHQCMTTRGIHKTGVSMVTSRMLGVFRDHAETRQEFLAAIGMRGGVHVANGG